MSEGKTEVTVTEQIEANVPTIASTVDASQSTTQEEKKHDVEYADEENKGQVRSKFIALLQYNSIILNSLHKIPHNQIYDFSTKIALKCASQ